ncbi:MAG: hypothetical protein QM696_10535 [Steroidobacteraceae bacterium]
MSRLSLAASLLMFCGMTWAAGETAAPADLSGVWLPTKQITTLRTEDGKIPPLKPAAAQAYQARVQARAKGKPIPDSTTYCQPDGVPRLMYAMMPFQILQKPEQITFVHEKGHMFRLIRMNEPEPEDPDPIFLGHSTAVWRNGELVVTTVGHNTLTTLDRAGLPHSEKMRVTEVYSLAPKGDRLRLRITIDDPETYEAPWSTKLEFRRLKGYRLKENVCQLTNPEFKSYYTPP